MRKLIFFLIKLVFLAFVILLAYIVFKEYTMPKPYGYDSIIVLGAQVKEDGSLSKQLELRLQKALEAYKNSNVLIVVTGARGYNEPVEESIAMKEWLVQHGVPEEQIIAESQSTSTKENILYAKQLLENYGKNKPVIVTSDYHLPRALAIAADNELIPQGIPSPTLQEYWLKNHSREVLAWAKYLFIKYVGSQK